MHVNIVVERHAGYFATYTDVTLVILLSIAAHDILQIPSYHNRKKSVTSC